jgi:hypothetical protein
MAEKIRWSLDQLAIKNKDWSRFDKRAGSKMTGQQYAESKVVDKINAGDHFIDLIIAKRTDLKEDLKVCSEWDLVTFDYESTWGSVDDFVAPPSSDVSPGFFTAFLNSLKVWE